MSAKEAIDPLAEMLWDRSFDGPGLEPRDIRNLSLGLEALAKQVDSLNTRVSILFGLLGVTIGFFAQTIFGG